MGPAASTPACRPPAAPRLPLARRRLAGAGPWPRPAAACLLPIARVTLRSARRGVKRRTAPTSAYRVPPSGITRAPCRRVTHRAPAVGTCLRSRIEPAAARLIDACAAGGAQSVDLAAGIAPTTVATAEPRASDACPASASCLRSGVGCAVDLSRGSRPALDECRRRGQSCDDLPAGSRLGRPNVWSASPAATAVRAAPALAAAVDLAAVGRRRRRYVRSWAVADARRLPTPRPGDRVVAALSPSSSRSRDVSPARPPAGPRVCRARALSSGGAGVPSARGERA